MAKSIIDYQNAYKEITDILMKNTNILSIFVLGSMVTGDLWEESDIDLFTIYKDDFEQVRDLYSEVMNIPVHIKFLSKKAFKEAYYECGKKDVIKNSLISSKLIYSMDHEISELYEKIIYSVNSDKGRWNLVYLGNLLKEIGICKKYLSTGRGYTAYELLIRALDNFSKLYLSINGYTVSKDSLNMACNLNDELNKRIKKLFYNEMNDENIKSIISYMESYLDYNIEKASKEILEFIKEEDKELSAYEIKNNDYFKNFNIKTEEILKVLYKNNVLTKNKREFRDHKECLLATENVYSYKH
ncbi:nucleotidyltransferase domain-containing protein [Clostridium sartagoforme]|uniref:nucleotidyltransferase domain-containing protein n=1 Tax=Clostridium sartagoforme TaxID=84031 RepID=UPI0031D56201